MRIKSMICDIKMKETTNQNNRKKKESPPPKKKTNPKQNKNKDRVSSLWDNSNHFNIHITGVPEGEEKEQEIGSLFEKLKKENFPNLVNEIDMQVQEAQRVSNKRDAESHSKRHHN